MKVLLFAIVLGMVPTSHAWLVSDHQMLTRLAVRSLPKDVPGFFRNASDTIGTIAGDPDIHKNKGTPILRERVYPEHYMDSELLKGKPWPESYYAYLKMLIADGQDPYGVGTLPYAVMEWTERLAMTFAELRKKPNDRALQMKAIVYAGNLAHYAGDLCQPLHTSMHHDGRAKANGESPHSGVHLRVDALPHQIPGLKPVSLMAPSGPSPAVREVVGAAFRASHALVDRVYELEAKFKDPPERAKRKGERFPALDPEVLSFGRERSEAVIRFTAELYALAWRRSAEIEIPGWTYQ